jgi:hypothetical protein
MDAYTKIIWSSSILYSTCSFTTHFHIHSARWLIINFLANTIGPYVNEEHRLSPYVNQWACFFSACHKIKYVKGDKLGFT